MFDNWLKTTLQQRFDQALDEPVPDELMAILSEQPEPRGEH